MSLRILCWNVNGIRACVKKGLLDLLKKEKPDIACFQEIKAFEHQCADIREFLKLPEQCWHPAKRPGYSGVMTAHVKSVETRTSCEAQKFDDEGRVLISDLGSAYLFNMYFPNGAERHEFKMDFLAHILPFFKKLDREKPLILTGDFNIAHKAIDIHDPVRLDGTSGFKPEEREWMDSFVAAGFTDTFRHVHGDKPHEYSWWSYRQAARERNKGWRIDYFFVSDRLKDKVRDMRMLQKVEGSDHCPLILHLDL